MRHKPTEKATALRQKRQEIGKERDEENALHILPSSMPTNDSNAASGVDGMGFQRPALRHATPSRQNATPSVNLMATNSPGWIITTTYALSINKCDVTLACGSLVQSIFKGKESYG